jgi:hypothetical protein
MKCVSRSASASHRTPVGGLPAGIVMVMAIWVCGIHVSNLSAQTPSAPPSDDLQVEINKKGIGKEVVIHRGTKEWYMLVEVAEGNTVIIRQEKEGETYILDESETHDRALSKPEIDGVIDDFINSVKTSAKKGKK